MEKRNKIEDDYSALDHDVGEIIADAHEAVSLPAELKSRMKAQVMNKIRQEKACKGDGFVVHRANDGGWVEVMPGASYKVLHDDGKGLEGVLSYLIKLDAGVEMAGHHHPFDEECLMLEGDLTFGDLTLNEGDFHFAAAGMSHANVSTKNGCIAFIRGPLPM